MAPRCSDPETLKPTLYYSATGVDPSQWHNQTTAGAHPPREVVRVSAATSNWSTHIRVCTITGRRQRSMTIDHLTSSVPEVDGLQFVEKLMSVYGYSSVMGNTRVLQLCSAALPSIIWTTCTMMFRERCHFYGLNPESVLGSRSISKGLKTSPRNRRQPPPLPVDEAPSWSQVDEPSTRRRLCFVPPPPSLRPLSRRLNAFFSIASSRHNQRIFLQSV